MIDINYSRENRFSSKKIYRSVIKVNVSPLNQITRVADMG